MDRGQVFGPSAHAPLIFVPQRHISRQFSFPIPFALLSLPNLCTASLSFPCSLPFPSLVRLCSLPLSAYLPLPCLEGAPNVGATTTASIPIAWANIPTTGSAALSNYPGYTAPSSPPTPPAGSSFLGQRPSPYGGPHAYGGPHSHGGPHSYGGPHSFGGPRRRESYWNTPSLYLQGCMYGHARRGAAV